MFNVSPLAKIVIGVAAMTLAGVLIPLLMVIHVLESTFLLNFGSYAISTAGLYLGIIGVAEYVRFDKKDK
jgi:hypothetical protein